MMEYTAFKNKVADSIKDYLPDEYKDCALRFCTVTKSDFEYEALMIEEAGKSGAVPALNITEAYNDYLNGTDFADILDELADIRLHAQLSSKINPSDILVLDKVKNLIIPRIINIEKHDKYLSDKPHTLIEDFAVTYAVRFESKSSCSDAVITDTLLQVWGIGAKELHEIAINNLSKKSPYFCSMLSYLTGNCDSINIDTLDITDHPIPFFILSNTSHMYGAAMILNSKLMKSITDKLGEVYIIPSSVHEVLILPKFAVSDAMELQDTIKSVNGNDVAPEDVLSNHVYEYYDETGSIAMVI